MNELRKAVREVSRKMFGGGLPRSQNEGTAFGMALAWELRPPTPDDLVLFGKPRKDEAKELLAGHGIGYVNREVLVDFVVARQESETKLVPLVGCESEMHSHHGVGYSLDGDNGYTFDFWKLLMFQAPHLVFAARVNTAWLDGLEESLVLCAGEYRDYWSGRSLRVVLLPSASRKLSEVRLGLGTADGGIEFERFDSRVGFKAQQDEGREPRAPTRKPPGGARLPHARNPHGKACKGCETDPADTPSDLSTPTKTLDFVHVLHAVHGRRRFCIGK